MTESGYVVHMCRLCMTIQPPAGLLVLERELAEWRPTEHDPIPPSWTVYRYVIGRRMWEEADRRVWETADRPGELTPAWKLELELRELQHSN